MHTPRKPSVVKRARGGPNSIRSMFELANKLNTKRTEEGLGPLLSLGIGVPHIPGNPLVDKYMKEFVDKKIKLRKQIDNAPSEEQKQAFIKDLLSWGESYQPAGGIDSVRQLIADLFNSWYPNLRAKAGNICITNGATQALSLIFHMLVQPGVKVGLFTPFFPPYANQVRAYGGEVVYLPTINCIPDILSLEKILLENPTLDVILLNDPCNPSGIKFSKELLEKFAQLLSKPEFSHIMIACDETYHELVYGDNQDFLLHVAPSEFATRVLVVSCLSKCMAGNPGLRFGFLYAPDIVEEDGTAFSLGTQASVAMLDYSCAVSTPVQYACGELIKAKLGLERSQEDIELNKKWETGMREAYSGVMNFAKELFVPESGFTFVCPPSGAFFSFVSAPQLIGKKIPEEITLLDGRVIKNLPTLVGSASFATDVHIAQYLVYTAEVVTIPGSGFCYDPTKGALRVSFATTPETLTEAVRRMTHAASLVV